MQILGRRKYRKMRKRGKTGFNPAEKKKEEREPDAPRTEQRDD